MNREDIVRMAREAAGGMLSYNAEGDWRLSEAEVERFAALVAAAEREQCATIAKDWDKDHPNTNYGGCIAKAIRARSKS